MKLRISTVSSEQEKILGVIDVKERYIFGRGRSVVPALSFINKEHGIFQKVKEKEYTYTDTSKYGSFFRPAKSIITGILKLFKRVEEIQLKRNEPINLSVGDRIIIHAPKEPQSDVVIEVISLKG